MYSEDQLIDRVRRKLPQASDGLRIGVGDDAAVIRPAGRAEWVVTTDAFLENVHFIKGVHPARSVGYKALARATSDLAAMGARTRYFLLTLALPDSETSKWLDDFLRGMAQAARQFGLVLAGGDTTQCLSVLISLTVIGEADPGRAILRSGARPGDLICVSGRLGEAELGLRLLQEGLHTKSPWKKLMKKHFYPEPRLEIGRWLAEYRCATAMIDTSDGLSTDLGHLCKASEVGAKIWSEKIPILSIPDDLKRIGLDPLQLALNGGEDYELVFTMPNTMAWLLPRKLAGVPITTIGEITRGKGINLVGPDGHSEPLHPEGWDPFLKRTSGT